MASGLLLQVSMITKTTKVEPNTLKRPVVFDYTDYRSFLRSYYDWQKTQNSEFSHSYFSKKAGLKSRSFLRLVLTGKRNLSTLGIDKFISGLELEGSEAVAFRLLVECNQATHLELMKSTWEQFQALLPKSKMYQRVHDEYRFLSRFAYPIIMVILRQNQHTHNVEGLSHMTGLSCAETKEGLSTLERLGLIKRVGPFITTSETIFHTSNDIPNLAIQSFHKNMLEKAQKALELDVSEREFQSVIIPLNNEELLFLKKRLRSLAEDFDTTFGKRRESSESLDRVYALNMNLIPVTSEFIRPLKKGETEPAETQTRSNQEI